MKNRLMKHVSAGIAALLIGAGLSPAAQANQFADRELAVGYQGGLSVRMPVKDDIKGQLIIGALGSANSIEVRGMRPLSSRDTFDFYGYGAASVWFWDGGAFYSSETAIGGGAGVGLDYDLRNLMPDLPPIYLSGELGVRFVTFDNYSAVDLLNLGLGLHYQF